MEESTNSEINGMDGIPVREVEATHSNENESTTIKRIASEDGSEVDIVKIRKKRDENDHDEVKHKLLDEIKEEREEEGSENAVKIRKKNNNMDYSKLEERFQAEWRELLEEWEADNERVSNRCNVVKETLPAFVVTSKGAGVAEEDLDTPEMLKLFKEQMRKWRHMYESEDINPARRKRYLNPMYRDSDLVAQSTPLSPTKWELTRRAAKEFKLECVNSKPLKTFKILTPSGYYIPETEIPQATLDEYQKAWEKNETTLVDYLLLYAHPETMELMEQEHPGEHLRHRYVGGYIQYRVAELLKPKRVGILTYENWVNQTHEKQHIASMEIIVAIRENEMKTML